MPPSPGGRTARQLPQIKDATAGADVDGVPASSLPHDQQGGAEGGLGAVASARGARAAAACGPPDGPHGPRAAQRTRRVGRRRRIGPEREGSEGCDRFFQLAHSSLARFLAPTMSGAVVKFLRETYGKASLLDCIKAGGWKAAIDGSLA